MPYQLIDTVTPDVGAKAGADKINNNAIQAQYQGGYFTVGGTANAITLTSATGAPSGYATGQEFCFRANTTNTGVTTVNVDGLGIKTIKTLSGADLPAGYLSTTVDTCLRYDGVNMVANVSTGALADQLPTNTNLSAAVCGTASFSGDVYTFTPSGTGFRPLQTGMYVSFRLPTGSVNATTTPDFSYNGSTYTIKWIDGSALAAGDIDETYNKQPILGYIDGTDMLIASDIRGSNSNGEWIRKENGQQECYRYLLENIAITSASGIGGFVGNGTPQSMPKTFSTAPQLASVTFVSNPVSAGLSAQATTTNYTVQYRTVSSSASADREAYVLFKGRWY